MRLGRLMQDRQELGVTFQNFEAERRPRAEKIVALARRNGNSKREFSATGAWIRDRMLKLLLPRHGQGNGLDVRVRSARGGAVAPGGGIAA